VRKEYIVKKIGKGTEEDPYRADLEGIDVKEGSIIQVLQDLGDKLKIEVIYDE